MDYSIVRGMLQAIPFNGHLGIEITEVSDGTSVVRLPEAPYLHNHVATQHAGALFTVAEAEIASSAFVDDANSLRAPGYEVMHLRLGSDRFPGFPALSVVAGLQNLFNRTYSPSLSVNAAAGKFFEPAPKRTLYVGAALKAGY